MKLDEDSEALKGIQIEWLHIKMISISLKADYADSNTWPNDNPILSTCRVFRFQLDVFGSVTRDKPIWMLRVTTKEKVMKMMEMESSSSRLYILGDSTTFMIELKHHWRELGSGYYSELEDEASCNISRTLQLQIQRNLYALSSSALIELLSKT